MNTEKIKNIILDKANAIPTIPHVIRRLIPLLQNENIPIDDIQQIIASDIAISTRLLKVANSAYYGLMRQVTTVRQAINVLGMRQVKSLALGITVLETMQRIARHPTLDYRDLWMHSIGSSIAATMVCEVTGGVDREIAFTAAMLHDMGKLPLSGLFAEDYEHVLSSCAQHVSLAAAERDVFGIDHSDVGGWLCDIWKFPRMLTLPIREHHQDPAANTGMQTITSIVILADYLSRSAGIGHGGNSNDTRIPEEVCGQLRLSCPLLDELRLRVADKKNQAAAFCEAAQ